MDYYYYSESEDSCFSSERSEEWNGYYEDDNVVIEPTDFSLVPLPKPSFMMTVSDYEIATPLTLVPLPKPYSMIQTSEEDKIVVPDVPEPDLDVAPRPTWKKIDYTETPPPDPWAFLKAEEEAKKKESATRRREEKDTRRRPPASHSRSSRTNSRPPSLLNSIDNTQTNRLCKYKDACRMHREGRCAMIHSLDQWKPRICRFQSNCVRKDECGYYHPDTPLRQYLAVMIKKTDSIYFSNASLYEKYLS
jgi:hypothetical protein